MRYRQMLLITRKEAPSDAQSISHILMERTGMIRKLSAGLYNYYPLMVRSIRKVEAIIREELNRAGAQEVLMPAVQPAALWERSGRWDQYGPELLRFRDRKGNEYCYGPTHEEVITDIVANEVNSYKQLPLNLYQIQTKFRDEIRPRFGLMRGREFIMKDAYSFDTCPEAAKKSYWTMFEAYNRIFTRCGFAFRPVAADTGNIGGTLSHEFQVLADTGEDAIVSCSHCDYAANVEKAESRLPVVEEPDPASFLPLEEVHTPNRKSIEEVSGFLGVPPTDLAKTLIYFDDQERFYAVVIRGDLEVNELKLKNVLGAVAVYPADEKDIAGRAGVPVGFIGPVKGMELPVICDLSLKSMRNGVTGANKADYHLRNFNPGRDIPGQPQWADVRQVRGGEPCPRCEEGHLVLQRGIEVGHVFFLGTKYSAPMGATFLDEDGLDKPAAMGCYGIGVTRTVAAAIEQHHDEDGICWPMPLAPMQVIITPILYKDEMKDVADRLYADLLSRGVEVLLDDRDERAGVKFKDADLLGFPLRIVVGDRKLKEGLVEMYDRREKRRFDVPLAQAVEETLAFIRSAMDACRPA